MITNPGSKTRVDEVADGIYRINTPVDVVPGGFSFNQYLVVDEEPEPPNRRLSQSIMRAMLQGCSAKR